MGGGIGKDVQSILRVFGAEVVHFLIQFQIHIPIRILGPI